MSNKVKRKLRKEITSKFMLLLFFLSSSTHATTFAWLQDSHQNWLRVEIADTPKKQSQGLMYRPYLLPNYGMLFIFDNPRPLSFWMKNTWRTLDIRFYDENGILINRHPYAQPCLQTHCPYYNATQNAKYVLETAAQPIDHLPIGNLISIIYSQSTD